MSDVLVIGAHGRVALLAEELLVKDGHTVTGMVRNPDHVGDVRATGAEPLVADIEQLDVAELTDLLADYEVVVWSAGAGGGNPPRTYAVDRDAAIRTADAAVAAGTAHFVMVSYFGAGPAHGVSPDNFFFPYAESKSIADAYLEQTPLNWTILRPSTLTDDTAVTGIATSDEVERTVSRSTVARVVAAVVGSREAAARRIIRFNVGEEDVETVVAGRE